MLKNKNKRNYDERQEIDRRIELCGLSAIRMEKKGLKSERLERRKKSESFWKEWEKE